MFQAILQAARQDHRCGESAHRPVLKNTEVQRSSRRWAPIHDELDIGKAALPQDRADGRRRCATANISCWTLLFRFLSCGRSSRTACFWRNRRCTNSSGSAVTRNCILRPRATGPAEAASGAGAINGGRRSIQRYKGLGEMDAKELWRPPWIPRSCVASWSLDDAAAADELFSILMGEDVDARRSFITRQRQGCSVPGCLTQPCVRLQTRNR